MRYERLRKIRTNLRLAARFGWKKKGLWLRAFVCWLIGMAFIVGDRTPDYDQRLLIRNAQPTDDQIIILMITRDDWEKWLGDRVGNISHLKEANYFKDSFYWNADAWWQLLSTILHENPLTIAISPYFGENIPRPNLELKRSPILTNSKIIWSAQIDDEGRILPSAFAKTYSRNTGLNEHLADRDGIIRRFGFTSEQIPHMAVQIARRLSDLQFDDWTRFSEESPIINFRGSAGSFTQIGLPDAIDGHYPKGFFKNKIVVIGTQDSDGIDYRTPVGKMSRAEILANLVDNIRNVRWIERPNLPFVMLLILLMVLLVAWITSNYPQFLAFFIILCFNVFFATFSLWMFDAHYFWLPIMAPAVTSFVTYFTFLSFQLTLKEYLNTQLETERQFLFEVEQLKDNFLSLISHDLKTPIAKIQAICDRLLTDHATQEFSGDLVSLREVASELHRYIQTILQITRVESRDFRISKDATDLNEIIEAVVHQLEPLAKNKKMLITASLEPMFLIEVDQVLIHEVVLNLIENAIKYTPEGGTVKVSSREVDNQVIFMVEDTGPGIPIEEQAKIFEKFYRGESGKSQPKGSGLGLYLVKYFVELHSGKVFIDSSPKSGTKVGFSLPIVEGEGYEVDVNANPKKAGEPNYAT